MTPADPTPPRDDLSAALDRLLDGPPDDGPCPHEWHYYGTVNGRPDYGCQLCGATRTEE